MLSPPDGSFARNGGSPAATLIVVDQLTAPRECIEVRKEIVVMSAGTAMQDYNRWPMPYPPLEETDTANFPASGLLASFTGGHRLRVTLLTHQQPVAPAPLPRV
jgi:hypothetical protein